MSKYSLLNSAEEIYQHPVGTIFMDDTMHSFQMMPDGEGSVTFYEMGDAPSHDHPNGHWVEFPVRVIFDPRGDVLWEEFNGDEHLLASDYPHWRSPR